MNWMVRNDPVDVCLGQTKPVQDDLGFLGHALDRAAEYLAAVELDVECRVVFHETVAGRAEIGNLQGIGDFAVATKM